MNEQTEAAKAHDSNGDLLVPGDLVRYAPEKRLCELESFGSSGQTWTVEAVNYNGVAVIRKSNPRSCFSETSSSLILLRREEAAGSLR